MNTEINFRCSVCETDKPGSAFGRDHGVRSKRCKKCRSAKQMEWAAKNPELVRAQRRDYYLRNKSTFKHTRLKRHHGIGLDQYRDMEKRQNGKCAICELVPKDGILRVDHNHTTGVIRGLLCDSCNRGIGFLRDSQSNLQRAADYVSTEPFKIIKSA